MAERLRRATHRTFAEEPLPVTISFGVATYPDHGSERSLLMAAASRAMAAAKEMGKRSLGDLQPGDRAHAGRAARP